LQALLKGALPNVTIINEPTRVDNSKTTAPTPTPPPAPAQQPQQQTLLQQAQPTPITTATATVQQLPKVLPTAPKIEAKGKCKKCFQNDCFN